MPAQDIAAAVRESLGDGHPPIVVLTGAGISAESGLSTFRGAGGLWAGHRVEDVACPAAFARDPAMVHDFYNARRRRLLDPSIGHNAAHAALATLEANWPAPVTIITQNVDDLHERAGSQRVIHMHGELLKVRDQCSGVVLDWRADCGVELDDGRWRPHIVWFGEAIMEAEAIAEALQSAGLFLCIGTAGQVYPAAGFVHEVVGPSVEFNLEVTQISSAFDHAVHAPSSESLPKFVACMLAR
jgi:NAD-dependent deacetylase